MSTTLEIRTTETQPYVLLPTFINGKGPFEFVLDTGAGISMITEDLARTLEVQNIEAKEAQGAGGKKTGVFVGRVSSMSVGGSKVENSRVGIMKTLPKCIGQGIIGHSFLRKYVLTIDYRHNRVTLAAPDVHRGKDQVSHSSMPLKLARPDRPIILVDVLVNAQKLFQFILDTGASQTVVSPELALQTGIKRRDGDALIGAGGAVPSSVGTMKSLQIENAVLEGVTVIVSDVFSPLMQATGARMDGILGYNVLREFTLTIDYPNERLQKPS